MTRIKDMIIKFGLSKETKICTYCCKNNNLDNTNCWYCNKDFKVNMLGGD